MNKFLWLGALGGVLYLFVTVTKGLIYYMGGTVGKWKADRLTRKAEQTKKQ